MKFAIGTTVRVLPSFRGAEKSGPCGPPRYRGRSVNGIREAVRYSLPFLIRCAAALVVSIVLLVALGVDPAFVAIVLTLALAAILAGHR
jgi:hydrogenase/urease accessory protein HupE